VNTFRFTCHECRFLGTGKRGMMHTCVPMTALEHTLKHGDYCDATHPQYLAILGKLESIILNAQEQEAKKKEEIKGRLFIPKVSWMT